MQLDFDTSSLPVSCDKVLIGQVILNIALNAIEEMSALDKGRRSLRIETRATGDSVMVAIHDLGRGVPHADGMRTFDFFSRAETASAWRYARVSCPDIGETSGRRTASLLAPHSRSAYRSAKRMKEEGIGRTSD